MAAATKTKNIIDIVRDGSIKWLNKTQNSSHDEFEEMKRSPSAEDKNWIHELSAVANAVVRRCSKVLDVSADQLRENFEVEASAVTKTPSRYARNFLEYSCFRALAQTTQVSGYMEDKRFRRLTFDMMIAWEVPDAASQPSTDIDEDATVGIEAFSRIASAVPVIADVIVSNYIFEFLTASTRSRLPFSTFEKYLIGLERVISPFIPTIWKRGRVLEVDGTVTTQPVLQHLGISTWPGRLTLTDHALYFEALRVVSYDKPTVYELADDLKQVVKAELTGPWGSRLFDKAVLYKSNSLSEPVIIELPELKGHARRDYWLAIVREILNAHRFIRKFHITGVERDEALLKAIFGVLRIQALSNMTSIIPLCYEAGLMYNACDQLPGGDRILETIATMLTSKETERNKNNNNKFGDGMHSLSATTMASSMGFVFGTNSNMPKQSLISVGELTVGEMTPLEKAVEEARSNYKMVADAQATVDGAKVEGLDTNLAVLKELLLPLTNLGNHLLALFYWEEPAKSLAFCSIFTFIIYCFFFPALLELDSPFPDMRAKTSHLSLVWFSTTVTITNVTPTPPHPPPPPPAAAPCAAPPPPSDPLIHSIYSFHHQHHHTPQIHQKHNLLSEQRSVTLRHLPPGTGFVVIRYLGLRFEDSCSFFEVEDGDVVGQK
ncbi:hypothetical protein E3N88_41929 [Mikania micrantha]|uniref:Uncharacterized protein n=1 Tax=Mikania micrantha TaxID=192012 RepID=A0A5N6LJB9_9ASTR|nr:hypothetical protein E3N88_41929 [Mikania micrantha]